VLVFLAFSHGFLVNSLHCQALQRTNSYNNKLTGFFISFASAFGGAYGFLSSFLASV
jgi:hypothetical protein